MPSHDVIGLPEDSKTQAASSQNRRSGPPTQVDLRPQARQQRFQSLQPALPPSIATTSYVIFMTMLPMRSAALSTRSAALLTCRYTSRILKAWSRWSRS